MELLHKDLTDKILGCYYRVYNEMGYGFNKYVFINCMRVDLMESNLSAVTELPATVYYHGHQVGTFTANLCVEGKIVVIVEAEELLNRTHDAKLLNYLKATDYEVGLLLNFGPKPSFLRKAYDNKNKRGRQEFGTNMESS